VEIEADETYIGQVGSHDPESWEFKTGEGWRRKDDSKMKVVTLVERGGRARSIKVDRMTSLGAYIILHENADAASVLYTDEARYYRRAGRAFAKHEAVDHSKEEWVRGRASTNTVEGYFSIFKRGMKGIYQHCGDKHLHRYLAEFDFRYSNRAALGVNDVLRTLRAIKGAEGKRLTYRRTRRQKAA
jgi:hypothetical protein